MPHSHRMRVQSLFFLLIWGYVWGYAQTGKLFSADVELSSSLINKVYQDKNGLIWIATEDGLNRYDGSKFTLYKHEEKKTDSPLHNYVRTLYEDSKGNFYIGFLNGLQTYDYATDTFKEIPIYLKNGDKFDAHVATMLERQSGEFLLGTAGHGLFALTYEEGNPVVRQVSADTPSKALVELFEDNEQNLWISTDNKGLFRIDRNKNVKRFFDTHRSPKDVITSICQNKDGEIFVGSMSTGLHKYHKDTDEFVPIPCPSYPNLPIQTLYITRENELLIGTDGYGMKIYSPKEQLVIDKDFNIITFDFSKAKIHSITEDQEGNTWLGIFQKGVMLLPSHLGKFGYIGYKSVSYNIIGSNCVMSVYKDSKGITWVGTDGDGLYGIDVKGGLQKHFAHTKHPKSVPSTIMCMFEDSENNLWLGSYFHGLAKVNRQTGECEYIKGIPGEEEYPIVRIYGLAEDEHKNLWIGTMGGGLFYMNLKDHKIIKHKSSDYHTDLEPINDWVDCLLKAQNGRLYIGTFDGVAAIDLETKAPVLHLLGRQPIHTLYEDHKGVIWIGTSEGLTSFNQESNITTTYTMNDGLPSNVICAITGDPQGYLWISTNYGISRFNPEERSFTNYYSSDGLQGNEFSKNAVCTNSNGQIIFGGINGITYFKPEDITDPEKELKIRLTDFYIHDKAVKKGMKSGSYEIIDTSVMNADKFHLSHKDNSFSIEFSTLEFSNPERITYMYSMNSNHWIRLRPGTNRISFNNLAPGKYHFRVMAMDYSISSNIKEIDITISPAWYASIWAKCLYWLISILLIVLIVMQIRQRYHSRQRLLEHIHAKDINEAKLQFFINISHEIRTPLSLVMSPLKKLIVTDKDPERQLDYFTMNRNIDRVLSLINQLLDIRKIDKGQMKLKMQEVEMVGFIKDVYALFEEPIKDKQIDYVFQHQVEKLNVWVDPRHFDKVIINVLSNAFKYTPEKGSITLSLNVVKDDTIVHGPQDFFEIMISDSGAGIIESEIERIFERFYQTKNTLIKSNEGTGVGLHLTRSIVELHHGNIKAKNNENGVGSTFVIRLPLGCTHLKPEEIEQEPTDYFREKRSVALPMEPVEDSVKVKSKSKRHVLVVDDDKEIRRYICRELSAEYHMTECANGKDALEAVLTKTPDLVISDVVMPEMDGITLCRKIKQNININHIPVILLTAKSKEEDNLEGLDTGADGYIIKPFNIEVLKKTAQNIIRNREMLRNNFSGSQKQKDKVKKISIKSSDDKLMERIMKVINDNITNPNLNVEMVATEVGISRVHLHRKLKELTSQSTRDLIRNIRLQQAATLLSTKSLTVSEVAAATGFTNLTHFSTSFKDMYGIPPMAYMEKHMKEREEDNK